MNKALTYSAIVLVATGAFVASCGTKSDGSSTTLPNATGGQSNTGGSSSAGGAATGGAATGGTTMKPVCATEAAAGHSYVDGGLVQIGQTIPTDSVKLDVGGFYAMSSEYHGYCYTIADKYDPETGSFLFPPCGTAVGAECFTADTGLCTTASLGAANGSKVWGGGIGCSIGQAQGTTYSGPASLVGKTSLTIEIYGCKIPTKLQMQLTQFNTTLDDAGVLGSGYFCKLVDLSPPDANGRSRATVNFADLKQDCWNSGILPTLDPSTMTAKNIQLQINSDPTARTEWDFCVSKLSID
jgi:hypothetical protein